MLSGSDQDSRLFRATCPDKKCQSLLSVTSFETMVECLNCGQKRERNALQNIQEIPEEETPWYLQFLVKRMLLANSLPKRGTEMVKVLGLSNYYCKLLSPFLTRYGMDKVTGRAKLLRDMNQGDIFDCSLFGDRAFLIEPEHINIAGFGRDITGSTDYLSGTLKLITSANEGDERLIPVHADGDGHCLVHAISRALVGRELFWHPLRCCLKRHFQNNLAEYKELFKDFIDVLEWQAIIDECDPDFQPPEGELHGLRNIHIFGLANVLRRPIILLDSLECMQKSGDYSALFIPGFVSPEACRGKDNTLNKPLCIAWSSLSHNHYIPLVGVQKKPLPVLPSALIPKVWGMPQSQILSYIEFDDHGNCTIGGGRSLSDAYIHRLVSAMEVLFCDQRGVHPALVSDYKLYLAADNAIMFTKPSTIIQKTKSAVEEQRLFRCLNCKALCELRLERSWFTSGGILYNALLHAHKKLKSHTTYEFPVYGISCTYDSRKDEIIPDMNVSELKNCHWCKSSNLRKVKSDGSVIYKPEDKVDSENIRSLDQIDKVPHQVQEKIISDQSNVADHPKKITVRLNWKQKVIVESISWLDFHQISGRGLAQSVNDIAMNLIEKHFPDEIANIKLQSHVREEIWKQLGQPEIIDGTPVPSKSSTSNMEIDEALSITETKKESPSVSEIKIPASEQCVKVVTSRGQQATLKLSEKGISYTQLQEWIKNQFHIPVSSQRIKCGFPLKELKVSNDAADEILPLTHGDRLTVEVLQKEDQSTSALETSPYVPEYIPANSLTQIQSDMLWTLVKVFPEKFKKGGAFYQQFTGQSSFRDTKHASINSFPDKTFCYNSTEDAFELCVKPLGHFAISRDIEHRIEMVRRGETVDGFSKCPLMYNQKDQTMRPSAPASTERKPPSLVRKGPGFSVLTSPKSSDKMDIS